ncbi:hypothetical protein PCAR4_1090088 [Paraburkholderia caribensis]|nr:hypothetical protein PCAR4_1090088 [Paraburkholderia caribensis]
MANCVQAFAPYANHSGPGSKAGVSGKSATLYAGTTYTQFATYGAEIVRHH